MQDAVDKLLQKAEALDGSGTEPGDKAFFASSYSNYSLMLSQTLAWLTKGSTTIHPLPDAMTKQVPTQELSTARLPGIPRRRVRLSASQQKQSLHRVRLGVNSLLKASLHAARKAVPDMMSCLSLRSGSVMPLPEALQSASSLARGYSRLDTTAFDGPSGMGTAMHTEATADTLDISQHRQDTAGLVPGFTRNKSILRSKSSVAQHQGHQLAAAPSAGLPRTKSILRSKSSLTAASVFDRALSMSSSDGEGTLWVPEDLMESAMFLLRDTTLADPQAEVWLLGTTSHSQLCSLAAKGHAD